MVVNTSKYINKLNLNYVIKKQHLVFTNKVFPFCLSFTSLIFFKLLVFHNSVAQSQRTSISLIECSLWQHKSLR